MSPCLEIFLLVWMVPWRTWRWWSTHSCWSHVYRPSGGEYDVWGCCKVCNGATGDNLRLWARRQAAMIIRWRERVAGGQETGDQWRDRWMVWQTYFVPALKTTRRISMVKIKLQSPNGTFFCSTEIQRKKIFRTQWQFNILSTHLRPFSDAVQCGIGRLKLIP